MKEGAATGACTGGPVGTGVEVAGGAGDASVEGTMGAGGASAGGVMGADGRGACAEGCMGTCTGRAGEEPSGRGTKPDEGCLRDGAPKVDTGWEGMRAGRRPAAHEVPAGGSKTDEESSLVRKSSSCGGGEGRRREKGNVVSSKTTCREMMTRFVVRSRHRYPLWSGE